ncbi:MAG: SIMPL domain-containing protein [Bacteroidales bacterium]|nr:SIMPL domain-containing protein [Bacteroidales bacterium]
MKRTLIIAAAIVLAGAMLPVSVAKLKSYDRTVDVKGLCEREVKADKVIWPIMYKVMGNDLSEVLRQIDSNNSTILEFLREGGIRAEDITVSTPLISDKYASEYGNNDRVYRFLVTNTLTVCSEDIDAVMALQSRQSELMKKGIPTTGDTWENKTQFKFEALNDIKPEMIEEATGNARMAADKFAKDSGSRIGKIKTATQGTFSIEDRDSNTPYIKRIRVVTYVTYYIRH